MNLNQIYQTFFKSDFLKVKNRDSITDFRIHRTSALEFNRI